MITLGDNTTTPATGQGRVLVRMNAGDHYERAVQQDVLYVPHMGGNLLSVSHFARRGAEKAKAANFLTNAKTLLALATSAGIPTDEHAKIAIVNYFPSEGEDTPPIAMVAHARTHLHRRPHHLVPPPRTPPHRRRIAHAS